MRFSKTFWGTLASGKDPGPPLAMDSEAGRATLLFVQFLLKLVMVVFYHLRVDHRIRLNCRYTTTPLLLLLTFLNMPIGFMAMVMLRYLVEEIGFLEGIGKAMDNTLVGYHSNTRIRNLVEMFRGLLGAIYAFFMNLGTTATFEEIEWDQTFEIDAEEPALTDAELEDLESTVDFIAVRNRGFLMTGSVILGMILFGPLGSAILAGFTYVIFRADETSLHKYDDERTENSTPCPSQDGPVRICVSTLGTVSGYGSGIVFKGTLHTRLHVTNGAPLLCNGRWVYPTMVSHQSDLVTYFGPSRIKKPRENDELVALLVTPDCNTIAVSVRPRITPSGEVALRMVRTVPGTSGSPVFRVVRRVTGLTGYDEDDEADQQEAEGDPKVIGYDLVGVTGHFVRDETKRLPGQPRRTQVELLSYSDALKGPDKFGPDTTGLVQIMDHCGAGKTRTVIPQILEGARRSNRTVYITAPTRIICRDIFDNLHDRFNMSIFTSSKRYMSVSSNITVLPHASLVSRILSRRHEFNENTIVIVDEAHVQNSETMALVAWGRRLARDGKLTFVEMTATGKDAESGRVIMKKETNHPVTDFKLNKIEWERKIVEVAKSKPNIRVVVFMPSVQNKDGITAMTRRLREAAPDLTVIPFHRSTFERTLQLVRSQAPGQVVILTTNMSEIGVNLAADVVFDNRSQIAFSRDEISGHITARVEAATTAQVIQRRGRVGRSKPGLYFYQEKGQREDIYTSNCVELEESNMIFKAMTGGIHNFPLIQKWLEIRESETIEVTGYTTVRRMCDANGADLSEQTIVRNMALEFEDEDSYLVRDLGVRLKTYDARDRSWYEKYIKKAKALKDCDELEKDEVQDIDYASLLPDVDEQPSTETDMCVDFGESQFPELSEEHDLGTANIGRKLRHSHQCPDCDHKWEHNHEIRGIEGHGTNGLKCPCCRKSTVAKLISFAIS